MAVFLEFEDGLAQLNGDDLFFVFTGVRVLHALHILVTVEGGHALTGELVVGSHFLEV